MAYTISYELVTEAVSHFQRTNKVIDSVHIFLHCVARYSEQCESCDGVKEKPSTRQRPDHKQSLDNVRYQFHRLLLDDANWYKLNETLKVFLLYII